jgi:hypothetical protein
MSTMAMPVVLDGPLPVRRPFGILSVADVLGADLDDRGVPRWLNGGTVYGYPAGEPTLWDACSAGTFRTKAEGEPVPTPSFGAVTLYLAITCTMASVGNPDTFANRARLAAAAKSEFGIERQLVSGTGVSTNPYLADSNAFILNGGTAVDPKEGLALLEDATQGPISDVSGEEGLGSGGAQGVIHAPPSIVSAWGLDNVEKKTQLQSVNGTPIISGAGYIDQLPDDDQGALGETEQWAWGSGPLQLRLTEVEGVPDDISEALVRSGDDANRVTFRAERHFLVAWDTDVQVAVLIDRAA